MSFNNFDNYYQDYDYDSDPSPSPPLTRSGSLFHRRSPQRRATSSPPRTKSPVIGEDGWEVLPPELLDPSNWGLPPSSLSMTSSGGAKETHQDSTTRMYPGGSSRMFPGSGMGGGLMQFYPDHDPDLINTNQLDGMPYALQSSTVKISAAPKVVKNAAYSACGGHKKLSFSERWEQGLLEMAHSHPETLRNYSRIPPVKRGRFTSFGELGDDEEGGQDAMGTVPDPNFGGWNGGGRERGQRSGSAPASTPIYSLGGPGRPLASRSGGGNAPGFTLGGPDRPLSSGQPLGGSGRGRGRANTLPIIHEPSRTLSGAYGSAASSKAAARDAALRRDEATKVEQIRHKAELKREGYMKEIRQREKAAAKKAKLAEEEAEERVRQEKLEKDREARDRKAKDWDKKSKDVRWLAAEAAARRDAATKEIQRERAESLAGKRKREEREKKERARARAAKKREEEEVKYLLAQEKRQHEVEARNSKARDGQVKYKGARQLAREAAERRFAAMEKEKKAEGRGRPAQPREPGVKAAQANTLVCEECGKRFSSEAQVSLHADKSGHRNFAEIKPGPLKPAIKPAPAPTPIKKATPAPKVASANTPAKAPEKTTLPSRPAPAKTASQQVPRAPSHPPSPSESDEEKLTARERVRLAMARREAAIRALPAEEPSSCEEELLTPPATPKSAATLAKIAPRAATAKSTAGMLVTAKARQEAKAQCEAKLRGNEGRAEQRRIAAAEANRAKELEEKARKSAEKIEEQLESVKKPTWGFGGLKNLKR